MLPPSSRNRIYLILILVALLTGLSTQASAAASSGAIGTASASSDSTTNTKLGCSNTPHEGSLCLTITDTGAIRIERFTAAGYWMIATYSEGSALLARGTGYQLGLGTGADPTPISHILTGDTVYTVLNISGLIVTQAVTYQDGDDWVGYKWSINNPARDTADDVRFIHANYPNPNNSSNAPAPNPTWNGSDTVGVTYASGALSGSWTMALQGLSLPDAYESGDSTTVQHVNQFTLDNTLDPSESHTYALQWNRAALAGGETWEINAREKIDYTQIAPQLTVNRYLRLAGKDGKITSSPPGIDCGPASNPNSVCSASFEKGTTVQISVTPDPGSAFFGWVDPNWYSEVISQDNPLSVTLDTSKTVVAGFSQNPVDVTFTFTDGGAHANMPLYGRLTILWSNHSINYYYPDLFHGQVTVSLDQGEDYTLIAESNGYITQVRSANYSTPTASETFALLPDPVVGCPIGYQKSTSTTPVTVLNESFESGGLPAGWGQFSYQNPGPGWTVVPEGYTGSTSAFHDTVTASGSGSLFMDHLISPPIHIPANATLTFYQKSKILSSYKRHGLFLYDSALQQMITWLNDPAKPAQEDTWESVTRSLSNYAGRDLAIGFYYEVSTPPSGDQWFIDDVKVAGVQGTCEPLSGGRVAGYVTNSLITDPIFGDISGASVTGNGSTFTTPGNGQYYLWLPTGSGQVTASAAGYFSQTAALTLTEDVINRQDFALERGYTLTTFTTGTGSGTVSADKTPLYHLGETVQLTTTPSPGMRFAGWAGSGIDGGNRSTNPLPLTIAGNMSVVAAFEPNPVTVTVTLTDGGAHSGTPLSGTVYVTTTDRYAAVAYPTDPFTGQATLSLDQGVTYYFTASAPGYASRALVKSYLVTTASESFALLPDPALGCPLGYQLNSLGTQTLLNEGFESGAIPPAGWSQSARWLASSAANTGNYSAFHDIYNSMYNSEDYLRSPKVHIPANAHLSFSQKVNLRQQNYGGGHYIYVSSSSSLWTGNEEFISIAAPPAVQNTWGDVTYDLSMYAGQDLYIVFIHNSYSDNEYYTDDQWWLDDVKLTGDSGTCPALNGGRVAGQVTDSVTAAALSGAAVSSGTPAPAATDSTGLYTLWAQVGSTLLTASANSHLDQSATVTIPAGSTSVTRQDFALTPTFTITTQVTGSGAIEARVNGNLDPGPYLPGTQVTLTALPAEHNHFLKWEDDSTTTERTVTLNSNLDVTATFAVDTFAITTHTVGSGTIEARVNGSHNSGPYPYNMQVTLTALSTAHSHFVEWDDHSTSPTRTVTVTADLDVTATFAEYTYSVTKHIIGDGSIEARVNGSLDPGPYPSGMQVTLTALPGAHSHFVKWENNSTVAERTFTVTTNLNVTATFAVDTFTIATAITGDSTGAIEARVNSNLYPGPYPYNTLVTLTAVPGPHTHFVKWENDSTNPVRIILVTGNLSVMATFAPDTFTPDTFTITTHTAGSGNGSIETRVNGKLDPGPYFYNTQVTLTTVPAALSHFAGWEDGSTAAERTVTITGNMDVTATFTPYQADLAVTLESTFTGPGSMRYTIVVTNLGPDSAGGALVKDTFGSGLGSVTWTCAGKNGAACSNPSGSGDLNETITSLPSGGSLTLTVDAVLLDGSGLLNTVTVTAPAVDPVPANNTSSTTVRRLYLPSVTNP